MIESIKGLPDAYDNTGYDVLQDQDYNEFVHQVEALLHEMSEAELQETPDEAAHANAYYKLQNLVASNPGFASRFGNI